jgi:hypothetical protein
MPERRGGHRRPSPMTLLAVALSAAIPMLAVPAGSAAQEAQSPERFSAGDQYVETLPSTKGPKAANGKRHRNGDKGAALPPELREKLLAQGGPQAAKLLEIATSGELGAPERRRGASRAGQSEPGVPAAAIDAVGGGQSGLGWLVLALIVITALALGALGYQRYRDKGSAS